MVQNGSDSTTEPMEAIHAQLSSLFSEGRWLDGAENSHNTHRVLVAYSGGVDSHVLLALCARAWGEAGQGAVELFAVHVNHQLHPDAARWAAHCSQVCDELGVALISREVELDNTGSLEQQARSARYAVFEELLEPQDLFLLAHHQDDQLETGLFRLLRGHRFTGMPVSRPLGQGWLSRPLLHLSQSAIETWAREAGLSWIEDSSNASLAHDRNYLRHEILPALMQRWSGLRQVLANTLDDELEQMLLLAEVGEMDRQQLAMATPAPLHALALDGLSELTRQRRQNVLRHWCSQLGLPLPNKHVLKELERQLKNDAAVSVSWGNTFLTTFRRGIYLYVALPEPSEAEFLPGSFVSTVGTLTYEYKMAAGLACELKDLLVRTWQPGDRIQDQEGQSHNVAQLMQEAGVPAWLRPHVPVVLLAGELVAVPALPQFSFQGRCQNRLRPSESEQGVNFFWSFQ